MSAHRLLANHNNAVPAATVTASSIFPAERQVFPQPLARQGNGQVIVSGGYTGANDADLEIEIAASAGTGARVSRPVFSGAGNGQMTQPTAADGTASQDVIITLVDLGTATTRAQAVIYGDVLLRAKAAGAAGNALSLRVTPNLALSGKPVGALSFALSKDAQEWSDQKHDFGALPLDPGGTIPANAPRLVFGRDLSRVYRHYKRWDGEQWQYGISPKLATDHAAGATVHAVTGGYSVAVTAGATTETYSAVTLYDLLLALNASALIDVAAVIANDRKPGGMAAIDLPLRTAAFALPVVASNAEQMPDLQGLIIAPVAPTETVSVECVDNSPVGSERWAVKSRVAGALADAITGRPYTDSPYVQFTVPVIGRTAQPIEGRIAIVARSFPRQKDDKIGIPAVCLYKPALGAKAASKTLRLVWTERPPADCDCKDANVTGGPSPGCLGINIDGSDGGENVGTLIAGYQSRLILLYQWRAEFIQSNTAVESGGELRSAGFDVELANTATGLFAQCLADLYADSDTPASGALGSWDAFLSSLDTDLASLETTGAATPASIPRLTGNTAYTVGNVVAWGSFANVSYLRCVSGGITGAETPEGIGIGTVLWEPISRTEAMASAGGGGTNQDINTVDAAESDPAGIVRDIATFVQRYSAKMDYVRALAGIVPKSEAGGAGGACWQDQKTNFYWQIEGTEYLPVFNGIYYHSAVKIYDSDARREKIVSTFEFGFGLQVACENRLQPGDSITITINDVSADYPYKIGDRYDIPLVAGGPLAFAGGINGTDTLTFTAKSTAGALPDYALTAAEPAYSASGLGFSIHRGALPFALGDAFRFSVETGGRFRWRKDGAAWSGETAIADAVALADGLTAAFSSGASPSFVASDRYRYRIRQPNSPSHAKIAHGETWRWSGSTASLTLTWATDRPISVIGLLRHGLAAPASVTVTLRDAADAPLHVFTPAAKPGPLLALLPATVQARKLTITISDAAGMTLGWVYAGEPFATANPYLRCTFKAAYSLESGAERNPRGAYLGEGRGGEIEWDFMSQADFDALLALVGACKRDGNAPLVVLPNTKFPESAMLARIDADAIDFKDWWEFRADDSARRCIAATLPFAAVLS
ncbi:MAG TPA: hypothetical protein DCQ84_14020 [Candidatus Competibacteraceae bacterium]|nr:hypothetical protein [Candidatus Competibacteraceae bacterium]